MPNTDMVVVRKIFESDFTYKNVKKIALNYTKLCKLFIAIHRHHIIIPLSELDRYPY